MEGKFVVWFLVGFFQCFFRTESFAFSELVVQPHKGDVEHVIFAVCVSTVLRYCNCRRERTVNVVGSGSYCKSKKDPISMCLPLHPSSQLRTGQKYRRKVGALHLNLEMEVFQGH